MPPKKTIKIPVAQSIFCHRRVISREHISSMSVAIIDANGLCLITRRVPRSDRQSLIPVCPWVVGKVSIVQAGQGIQEPDPRYSLKLNPVYSQESHLERSRSSGKERDLPQR